MASISLYNVTDNLKKMSKNLSGLIGTATTIEPYMPLSDLTGTVLLAYSATREAANYASINFGTAESPITKYFFITDRSLEPGNKIRLFLKIDVLKTYETSIRTMPVTLRRCSEGNFQNWYLADNDVPLLNKPEIVIHNFGTFTYTEDQYIINIVG